MIVGDTPFHCIKTHLSVRENEKITKHKKECRRHEADCAYPYLYSTGSGCGLFSVFRLRVGHPGWHGHLLVGFLRSCMCKDDSSSLQFPEDHLFQNSVNNGAPGRKRKPA